MLEKDEDEDIGSCCSYVDEKCWVEEFPVSPTPLPPLTPYADAATVVGTEANVDD